MTVRAEWTFAEWARSEGWTVTKNGWPDFMCRRGAERMAVEVKDGRDNLRPDQEQTLVDLDAVGIPSFVWMPDEGLMPIGFRQAQSPEAVIARLTEELFAVRQQLVEARAQIPVYDPKPPKRRRRRSPTFPDAPTRGGGRP